MRHIIFFTLYILSLSLAAQTATFTLSGVVRDSISHAPVPFATVLLKGTDRGELTDDQGHFSITTSLPFDSVMSSAMGYRTKSVAVRKRNNAAKIAIDLAPTGVMLSEVTARPKREHYSKRNNPAVAFMERIRKTADLNDPRRNPHYNYDKYERITLAINDYRFDDSARSGIDKMFSFLKEYVDTSEMSGKPILNVAVREKLSEVHFRHDPKSEKEWVTGLRNAGDRKSVV